MKTSKIDTILHPVRLRIITAIQDREMTPQQLKQSIPDVPQATLYRHIAVLEREGILKLIAVNPVRGANERLLALSGPAAVSITEEELLQADRGDHLRYFTSFMISLLKGFERSLESVEEIHEITGRIGYHTHPVYLSEEELADFSREFNSLIRKYSDARSAEILSPAAGHSSPGRQEQTTTGRQDRQNRQDRYLLSTILMPAADQETIKKKENTNE